MHGLVTLSLVLTLFIHFTWMTTAQVLLVDKIEAYLRYYFRYPSIALGTFLFLFSIISTLMILLHLLTIRT